MRRKGMFSYSHYPMLECRVRMNAYRRAIFSVVREGDVVADLGAGTGILSFWAVEAGAKQVFAVDQDSIIYSAREIARANGMDDKITFLQGNSRDIELPRKADVLVSELLSSFGIEDGVIEVVADVRGRWLKKKHRMIPLGFSLHAAPVESAAAYRKVSFWDDVRGFDYAPIKANMVNSYWVEQFEGEDLLARPIKIKEVDLTREEETLLNSSSLFTAVRAGSLHGFCGFFKTRLTEEVSFSTSPRSAPTHWKQLFFPLPRPIKIDKGDKIRLTLLSSRVNGGLHLNWRAEAYTGRRHITLPGSSTLLGWLDSLRDLEKLSPE
jgi:predicted RNA methylase